MSKNRSRGARRRSLRSRKPRPLRSAAGIPRFTTPEGDDVVFATARYRHDALGDILAILGEFDEFGLKDELGPEVEAKLRAEADGEFSDEARFEFPWFETRPEAPEPAAPIVRRVLASVTLMEETLEVDAPSCRRLADCRQRLEELLGDRIRLVETRALSPEEALRQGPPSDPADFVLLPPEVLAQLEEQMLREWIDDSIPALGGQTPREAVKTPEGREQVLELIDYITDAQAQQSRPAGMFSPDYRKVKEMLGLEKSE